MGNESILGSTTQPGSLNNIQFNEENLHKLIQIVYAKLTQIMHDMSEFNIPQNQIKSLVHKYLKQSKIFPPNMQQEILMRLDMQEREAAEFKKKNLIVNDSLFDNNFQSKNREQRSTLFFGVKKLEAKKFTMA